MHAQYLNGLAFRTPFHDEPQRLTVLSAFLGQTTFRLGDDSTVYTLRVADEYLISHTERIKGWLATWLYNGAPEKTLTLSGLEVTGR